ncbi:hypothetical protein HB780_06085 (plasmid) [Rhizobium lusitanum]|uniref:VpaChn25_0724 family phage protein n=1 Tax=Rhizobium lusitanum TaxID=293958 RepID=UPI00160E78EF|nr:hypothetical protein [Rhizobium lusitanum]QND45316.1 hypothetical protein HB780_06085 [Rhizobium lusitanum]
MSDLSTDLQRILREEARLTILKALGAQDNETLSSSMIEEILPQFAIRQERPWIHQQMVYLRDMGAITLHDAGSVKIGTLTNLGRRHLDRDTIIEGVKRPSRRGD